MVESKRGGKSYGQSGSDRWGAGEGSPELLPAVVRERLFSAAVHSVANVALDIVFVARLHWGIAGIGWATVLCQGCACVPALWMALRRIRALESPAPASPVTRDALREFAESAFPGVLQQSVVAAGNILIQMVVNSYGVSVAAGYSAAVKLNNLLRDPSPDALRAGVDFLHVAAPFYLRSKKRQKERAFLCKGSF